MVKNAINATMVCPFRLQAAEMLVAETAIKGGILKNLNNKIGAFTRLVFTFWTVVRENFLREY